MTTIVTRAGKGTPLTNNEVDTNFTNLNTDKLELGGTFASGTANSVLYLNGSKALTSGSALTFDGTNLSAGSSAQNLGTPSARWGTVYTTALSDGTDQLVGSSGTAVRIGYGASWTAQSFAIGGSEQMRLTSTGLGIGTSSPDYKLQVSGTSGQTFSIERVASSIGSSTSLGTIVGTGEIPTLTADGASIQFLGAGLWSATSAPGRIVFNTTPVSATTPVERFQLTTGEAVFNDPGNNYDFRVEGDTDANLIFADASTDRVGVGTATPSVKFDVAGTIRSTGTNANLGGTATTGNAQLALTTNARIWTLYTANSSSGLQFRDETAGLERMQITPTGQVNIGGNFTSTNNTLQVTGNTAIGYTAAAPTDGLIVAGNVGIGASSPQGPLEVAATGATVNQFLTGGTGNNAVTGIFRIGSGTGRGASIQGFRGASSNIHSLDFYTYNSADVFGMRLDSSGNLGIGTSSPSTFGKLAVVGSVDVNNLVSFRTNDPTVNNTSFNSIVDITGTAKDSGGVVRYNNTTIEALGSTSNGGTLVFRTDDSSAVLQERMRIDLSGNVGIGTTNPGAKLHVEGTEIRIKNGTDVPYITLAGRSTDGTAILAFQNNASSANNATLTATTNTLAIATGGTERARITSGGTFQTSLDASIYGVTVGRGSGAVSTNTAVGASALAANTTGAFNVAFGTQALPANTTGQRNVSVGRQSMFLNTTGGYNVAVGMNTLEQNTTASYNVAVGYTALQVNTTGANNTAIGTNALIANTTASNNTAVGYEAGYSNTTGASGVFLGIQAGYANTTGAGNILIGALAGYLITTANGVTAIGFNALSSSTSTGSNNTALGSYTLRANTTGTMNTAIGGGEYGVEYGALGYNTTGSYNTAVGHYALRANTTASYNTAVGYNALNANTTGADNVAMGVAALAANTTGASNTAVGRATLVYNTTGIQNAGFAEGALLNNTSGNYNSAYGYRALFSNTTASNNTAVGYQALNANTTASGNTALGYQAGYSNTTGSGNVFLGNQAGLSVTTSNGQTFIGQGAGASKTTGGNNTFVGTSAGASATTGTGNTFIGVNDSTNGAGYAVTTGSKNTIIGGYTGNQGGLDIRTASNYIVLSDGDGNPRGVFDSSGRFLVNQTSAAYQSPNGSIQYPSGAHLLSGGFGRFWVPGQSIGSAAYAGLYGLANTYNAYYSGGWKSIGGGTATAITIDEGNFSVSVSQGVGAADAALTWTTVLNTTKDATVALQGASPASGTGITFPATQSASSNANTLDDYEEGDWTPAYTGSGSNPTVVYNNRTAKYVKIGKQVTAWCYVYITSTTGGSGNIYLSGLPFTCTGVQGGAFNNWSNVGWTTQAPQTGHIPTGQTYVMLTYYIATGTAQVPVSNLANGSELTLCITYQTD